MKAYLFLILIILTSCNNNFEGIYRTDFIDSNEIVLHNNKTFEVSLHMCKQTIGTYENITNKKILLTSAFQKDSLPVESIINNLNSNRIILHNFPECAFKKNALSTINKNVCDISSLSIHSFSNKINIVDSIVILNVNRMEDSIIKLSINTPQIYKCSYSSYDFCIRLSNQFTDYHLYWDPSFLISISVKDEFLIKRNKLFWTNKNLLLKRQK